MHTAVIATSVAKDWMLGCCSALTARNSALLEPKHCHGVAENRGVMTRSDQFSNARTRTRVLIEHIPHEHCEKGEADMRWSFAEVAADFLYTAIGRATLMLAEKSNFIVV
jgi:hypothetical protein